MKTQNRQIIEDVLLILKEGATMRYIGDMAAIYAARTLVDNAITHHEERVMHRFRITGKYTQTVIKQATYLLTESSPDQSDIGGLYSAQFLLNSFIGEFDLGRQQQMEMDRAYTGSLSTQFGSNAS